MPIRSLLENFPNRIGRAQWWLGMAMIGAIMALAMAMGGEQNPIVMICSALLSLGIFILVTIPRLHDRNRSVGTAFACLMLAGVVARLFRHTLHGDVKWWAVAAVGTAFAVFAVIELGVLRGTSGDNPYGPDPLDETGGIKRAA